MKKLLLLVLLLVAMGGSVAPSWTSLLSFFGPAVAHAQDNDDSQGDNDNQGEDEQ